MNLYKIAAQAATDVYDRNLDLGGVEFQCSVVTYRGCRLQVLAFAGTNEAGDWLKNINLWSRKGVKRSAYNAAVKVNSYCGQRPAVPLLVTGHSKGGAEAIAYARLFGATWCIAFCPARALRYWVNRKMMNTTIFIDPDDPVPKAGCLSFGHPKCDRVTLPADHYGLKITDHFMKNINNFLKDGICMY